MLLMSLEMLVCNNILSYPVLQCLEDNLRVSPLFSSPLLVWTSSHVVMVFVQEDHWNCVLIMHLNKLHHGVNLKKFQTKSSLILLKLNKLSTFSPTKFAVRARILLINRLS